MSSASRRLPFSVAAALLGAPTASFAQAQDTPATPSALHATAFAVGLGVAAWMAVKAFDRPSSLAGLQTPPRYTTRNTQYLAGRIGFTAMCALLYSVLIVGHAEVLPAIKQLSPALYEQFVPGGGTSNYLLAVVLVTSFFLAFLNLDQEWNPLNMLREVIRSWVSIPQLASNLVARGEVGLDVPQQARAAIVAGAATPYVAIGDFEKDRDSIDRIWAELAYLYAWLRRQDGPADATFFQDPSFGWSELSAEFGDIAARIGRLKDGYAHAAMEFPDVKARVFALRKKMWRVVACYLVFKNGTDEDVSRAARALGIPTEDCVCENPLRYAVIYILGICGSVWLSVTMSAILFDWVEGRGLLEALGQSSELVTRWIAFSAANIGVPIIVILAMRYIGWRANPRTQQAYLVSYCWVFVVALAVAPLSLGAALKLFASAPTAAMDYPALVVRASKWAITPALIALYDIYYLDRQIDPRLPNVDQGRSVAARLANALVFATIVLVLVLPPVASLQGTETADNWPTDKLRAVAMGSTFFLALAMACIAQFALKKQDAGATAVGKDGNSTPAGSAPAPPPIATARAA